MTAEENDARRREGRKRGKNERGGGTKLSSQESPCESAGDADEGGMGGGTIASLRRLGFRMKSGCVPSLRFASHSSS